MDKLLWQSRDQTLQFTFSANGPDIRESAHNVPVDPQSVLYRRLQHYRMWCTSGNRTFRYLQLFRDGPGDDAQALSRPLLIEPAASDTVSVTMGPVLPHTQAPLQFSVANRIIDSISDGLLVAEAESINGGSRVTFFNQKFSQLVGDKSDGLLGLPLEEVYSDARNEEAMAALALARNQKKNCTTELSWQKPDGANCELRVSQSTLADETGWYTHVVSLFQDVTEEVANRQQLSRSAQLSRRMQEMAKTGWWRFELDSRVFEAGEGLLDICEVSEIPRTNADILKHVVVTDQSRVIELIQRCYETGRQSTTQVRIITGKQNNKWLSVHLEPEALHDGKVTSLLGTVVDITEIVESEQMQLRQHDELQFYLNCLDEYSCVIKLDADLRISFANEMYCKSIGLGRSQIYRKQVDELAPADQSLPAAFYSTLQLGQVWRGEWIQQSGIGSLVNFDVFASPRLSEEGEIDEVFVFLYEISSRKIAEEVSRQAANLRLGHADETLLRRGLLSLINVTNSEGGVLNLGEDVIVQPDGFSTDQGSELLEPISLDETLAGSIRLSGRAGGYSTELRGLLQPLIDAIMETERNRRNELLRQENQYILETLKIGTWHRKVNERRWYFSDGLFEMLQHPPPENGEVPETLWDARVSQREQKKLLRSMNEMLAKDDNYEVVVRVNLPDDSDIFVKIQGRLIRDAQGEADQVVGIASDVTTQIRTERELENQKSLASHQARMASIGELAAGVGHEINNPLAIVRGFLDITRNELLSGDLDEATILNLVEKMDESATRIGTIVDGLRSLSHAGTADDMPFSPGHTLGNTVSVVEAIYHRNGIRVTTEADLPDGLKIRGNEGKLQQVLMNLLSNARDATEGQAERQIHTSFKVDGDELVIRVEDNGPGVSADISERIFHPFFTTKEIGKGTGIGLSIAFSIVQEFKGTIVCETSVLGGARFVVRLPVSNDDVDVQQPAEGSVSETVALRRKGEQADFAGRVLIVDDEAGVREFLMLLLGQMGLTVDTAVNGEQAIEMFFAAEVPFDLVITDLTMPVMGGLELLDQLERRNKAEVVPRSTTAVLSTGLPDFTFDPRRYPMVVGTLAKPFNLMLLREVLQAASLQGVAGQQGAGHTNLGDAG